MGTYVVGDIHGCYDEWMALKHTIECQDRKAVFILLGDILDRGRKTRRLLIWCMLHISKNGRYQMVIGNHEYEQVKREKNLLKRCFLCRLPFYKDINVNGQRFIIAHADLPGSVVKEDGSLKENSELTEGERYEIVWNRSTEEFSAIPDAILIHGHTPTLFEEAFAPGDFEIGRFGRVYHNGNRINVDCGIGYLQRRFRRLAVVRLEDMQEFYYVPDRGAV